MISWTRAPEPVENAIIRGDTEAVRQALPGMTGSELGRSGFPLLFLAVQQDQPKIFALLLASGKFLPGHSGPDPLAPEGIALLKSLGCTPDPAMERRWGTLPSQPRLSLFHKLAHNRRKTAPDSVEPEWRNAMLNILVQCPTAELCLSAEDMEITGAGILVTALSNPSTQLTADGIVSILAPQSVPRTAFNRTFVARDGNSAEEVLGSLIDKADQITIKEALKLAVQERHHDTLAILLSRRGNELQPADFESLWECILENPPFDAMASMLAGYYKGDYETAVKQTLSKDISLWPVSRALSTLLDPARHRNTPGMPHIPTRQLSPETLHRVLLCAVTEGLIANGAGDRILFDTIWNDLDINAATCDPDNPDAPHLLIGALTAFGRGHRYVDEYLIHRITSDSRLNLPPETLASAFLKDFEMYLDYMRNLTQAPLREERNIIYLRNFDPNALVPGTSGKVPLLCEMVRKFGGEEKQVKAIRPAYIFSKELINHHAFDPYTEAPDGKELADCLEPLKKPKTGPDANDANNMFIDFILELLNEKMEKPGQAILKRLEQEFARKILPEQLTDEAGEPVKAVTHAARAGCLPQFLKAGAWSDNPAETDAYVNALENFPLSFRTQYGEQINACLNSLAEARVTQFRGTASLHFTKRYMPAKETDAPKAKGPDNVRSRQ